jgi:hypothetical protein
MTALRRRMIEDLQLRGLSKGTQIAYVRAVQQLAEYYGKSPDRISEEEVRQYFLYHVLFSAPLRSYSSPKSRFRLSGSVNGWSGSS